MFDESNLHSLIARQNRQRGIPLGKLLRESLNAAADEKFAVRTSSGLSPNWRAELRGLAGIAEVQRDWHWWHKPPWSDLKLLLLKEADYLAWLDEATRAPSSANAATSPIEQIAKTRKRSKRAAAQIAIEALYGSPPNEDEKPDPVLIDEVASWLRDKHGKKFSVSKDTILRAAKRRLR
jgi:hypothetical protein